MVHANERIGEMLVREGLITRDQLNLALQDQREAGTRLGYSLVALGFVKETDLTRTLARQYRMPAVDLSNFEVDSRIARLIPSEMAMSMAKIVCSPFWRHCGSTARTMA